jgi:hypothetical protein
MTVQTLITAMIVLTAFAYVARRYLPRRSRAIPLAIAPAASGCGSGCNACDGCPVALSRTKAR